MLLELSTAEFSSKAKLASWMLFPKPEDKIQRAKYRAEVERERLVYAYNSNASLPENSRRYYAEQVGDHLVFKERALSSDEAALFPGAMDPDNVLGEILKVEAGSRVAIKQDFALAFRAGYTAGCVLLNCFIYNDYKNDRYSGSQTKGESAAASLMKMSSKSIRNYFKAYKSVAHFWAAYQICPPAGFLTVAEEGIQHYSEHVAVNFLDQIDLNNQILSSSVFLKFGSGLQVGNGTLFAEEAMLRLHNAPDPVCALPIPEKIIHLSLQHRPSGKLSR